MGPELMKVRQAVEKGPFLMHRIEGLGLLQGKVQHLHGADLEAVFFKAADDVADEAALHPVGFDHG